MFQTLKMIPAKIGPIDGEMLGIMVFSLAGAIWLFLPFFGDLRQGRFHRWIFGLGIFAIAYMAAMTAYGYVAK
jgi:quinol-cytochrome oxidoreductase complex cytochrome b subunit